MIRRLIGLGCLMVMPLSAVADSQITGDAEMGEKGFRKCMACHAVGDDAKNKVGPILNGIVGRAVASVPDFEYSSALAELNAEGKVWTAEDLSAFLTKPRDFAKGTKMTFAGVRKEEERNDIIAYLATFTKDATQ